MQASEALNPQFLALSSGRLFAVLHSPQCASQHVVVLIPPFADEMNKSRRQFNLTAQALCKRGYAVVIFDLFGTGDSEGAFAETTIDKWQSNCVDLIDQLRQAGFTSCTLWAVRFGALLLPHLVEYSPLTVKQLLLWQPILDGKQALNQFLRIQATASMLSGAAGQSVKDLQAQLLDGRSVEVAGYLLSPEFYQHAQSLRLDRLSLPKEASVEWIQISSTDTLPMPVNNLVALWQSKELSVNCRSLPGETFWATSELVVNEPLCADSVEAVYGVIPVSCIDGNDYGN